MSNLPTITTKTFVEALHEAIAMQNETDHDSASVLAPFTFLYDVDAVDNATLTVEFGNPANLNELLRFTISVTQIETIPIDELPDLPTS